VNSGTRKEREGKKKIERLPIESRIKWKIEVYISPTKESSQEQSPGDDKRSDGLLMEGLFRQHRQLNQRIDR
jgi:hypothetical protein